MHIVFSGSWNYFFLHFNLDIFSSLYATDMYREYMPCIGNPAYSFRPILLKLYRYFEAFLWFHMRNLSLAGYNCSGGASCMACSFIWFCHEAAHLFLVMRKTIVRVSNWPAQLQKLTSLEILGIAATGIMLSRQWITMALIRLRRCASWFAFFLFAYGINRFSHEVSIMLRTGSQIRFQIIHQFNKNRLVKGRKFNSETREGKMKLNLSVYHLKVKLFI